MSIVKPTTSLVEITLPSAPKVDHGGNHGPRTFSAGAIRSSAVTEPTTPAETPATVPDDTTTAVRTEMPPPERVEEVLTAAADSIEEHGATPEQVAAMEQIIRIVMESGNPPAAAQRVLDLIAGEKGAKGCPELNGQCEHHTDDGYEIIHRGPEHKVELGGDVDLLTHRLIRWGSDSAPAVEYVDGGSWSEFSLPEVDELIAAVTRQLGSLIETRAHLAAALGEAPPSEPPKGEKARPADGATGAEVQA